MKKSILFFLFYRSPALKPLWLSLSGSDTEVLFSSLFRKFFCHESRQYLTALSVAKANRDKVLPAFLWHIKELASGLQQPKDSSLIIMEVGEEATNLTSREEVVNTPVVKVTLALGACINYVDMIMRIFDPLPPSLTSFLHKLMWYR